MRIFGTAVKCDLSDATRAERITSRLICTVRRLMRPSAPVEKVRSEGKTSRKSGSRQVARKVS